MSSCTSASLVQHGPRPHVSSGGQRSPVGEAASRTPTSPTRHRSQRARRRQLHSQKGPLAGAEIQVEAGLAALQRRRCVGELWGLPASGLLSQREYVFITCARQPTQLLAPLQILHLRSLAVDRMAEERTSEGACNE